MPPHFQFQTAAQSADTVALRIECLTYTLNTRGVFGLDEEDSIPATVGFNEKGGMDDGEFFEYLMTNILPLYPHARPLPGKWVVLKVDSGPGRLNNDLLAMLRFMGFLIFPGVPNTTAVTQETDWNYNEFKTIYRTNLELAVTEKQKQGQLLSFEPHFVPWVVYGGLNEKLKFTIVKSAFQEGFLREAC